MLSTQVMDTDRWGISLCNVRCSRFISRQTCLSSLKPRYGCPVSIKRVLSTSRASIRRLIKVQSRWIFRHRIHPRSRERGSSHPCLANIQPLVLRPIVTWVTLLPGVTSSLRRPSLHRLTVVWRAARVSPTCITLRWAVGTSLRKIASLRNKRQGA